VCVCACDACVSSATGAFCLSSSCETCIIFGCSNLLSKEANSDPPPLPLCRGSRAWLPNRSQKGAACLTS
jgi:hypothetical protein